ncbi:MAG: zinc ribbon domain-containing protein [Chloroflexota bacterium]|nr:zinc ribbon domain-containing protein [Chloroflexota bacterium]
MPIYDYHCIDCGHTVEILVRVPNSIPSHCPNCSSVNLEKLFSASYVVKKANENECISCCERAETCETPQCQMTGTCHRG